MSYFFDTQQIYRNLFDKGGFTEAQANALTDALRGIVTLNIDHLATKDDLKLLRSDVDLFRSEVKSEIDQLRSEMKIMQQQLTIRLGGIMVVGIGVLAAMMQFLGG